jgi:flagellar basal body-associated protein FliL
MKTEPHNRTFLGLSAAAVIAMIVWTAFPPARRAEASGGGAPPPAAGSVLTKVDALVVNLNDEDEVHYLKSSLELEVDSSKVDTITARMAVIRNELILHLSSLNYLDVRGEKAKSELLEKIKGRLNKALGSDMVQHVYFTELVVQ